MAELTIKEKRSQKIFLLKQLISRDFKSRYKRTILGIAWSMLSPLLFFLAQAVVFSFLFKRGEHYISYLIIGNIVYHYFTDATTNSMFSLQANMGIISKVKVDKGLFLLSRNISCLINFGLNLIIMFTIVAIDRTAFSFKFFIILIPIVCLFFLNMFLGYVLSVAYVFFKDVQYMYNLFTSVLIYFSAIFYRVEMLPQTIQKFLYFNPIYCYINYFRSIIMDKTMPEPIIQILCLLFPVLFGIMALIIHKKCDKKLVYYF